MAKPVHGISESKSLFGAPCLAHRLGGFTVNAAKGDESVGARTVQPVSKCQPCKQRAVRSLARTTSTSLSCLAVPLSAKDVLIVYSLALPFPFDVDLRSPYLSHT